MPDVLNVSSWGFKNNLDLADFAKAIVSTGTYDADRAGEPGSLVKGHELTHPWDHQLTINWSLTIDSIDRPLTISSRFTYDVNEEFDSDRFWSEILAFVSGVVDLYLEAGGVSGFFRGIKGWFSWRGHNSSKNWCLWTFMIDIDVSMIIYSHYSL